MAEVPLRKFDRQVVKYSPDQLTMRLNEIVANSNGQRFSKEYRQDNSNVTLIVGVQPDGSFGLKYWEKRGDQYVYISDAGGSGGEIGPTGPQGNQGPTGPMGPQGATGVGSTGATGAQGIQGATGPRGFTGATGDTGATGSQGIQGATGVQGVTGPQGGIGPQGVTGPQGTVGATGVQGPSGVIGATGVRGFTGPQGPSGVAGPTGVQGPTGPIGPSGATGPQGIQGASGTNGTNGFTGATGPQGPAGATGAGVTGATGPVGPTGPAGTDGIIGVDGATGPQGPAGPSGATGPQGATGPAGASGTAGASGVPGRTGATGPAGASGTAGSNGATGATGPARADDFSMNVTPTGTINGTNPIFTISPAFSSLNLYKNGVRLKPGAGNDYTVSGSTITMATPPATGTVLLADIVVASTVMIQGSNSLITGQAPTGTINGTNKVFTTTNAYISGSLEVFVNGLREIYFAETTPGSGTFTFDDAPLSGSNIRVNYQTVTSVSGNADTVDGSHLSEILNAIYPIGSVFVSGTDTLPSLISNMGTWVRLNGRVIVGVDTSQTEFNTVNKTGGHKLLQSHLHEQFVSYQTGNDGLIVRRDWSSDGVGTKYPQGVTTGTTGGGDSQNLQPYKTKYMWERTG